MRTLKVSSIFLKLLCTTAFCFSHSAYAFYVEAVNNETKQVCKVNNQYPVPNETATYVGNCEDGYITGQAKISWLVNGRLNQTSEGEFKQGKMHGNCSMQVVNRNIGYTGQCENDLAHGMGVRQESNEIRLEGRFENGKYIGIK